MNQLRWTIWWVNLDPVIGSEQGNLRPFLITDVTQPISIIEYFAFLYPFSYVVSSGPAL